MKRFTIILVVLGITVSLFSSCDKLTSNKYSGTYSGSMSSAADTSQVKKDNIKILITNNPLDESQLFMDGLTLTKESDSKYSLSGSQLVTIIQILFPDVKNDQIENANCELNFSENHLDLDIKYKLIEIVEVTAISYSGDKKESE